MNCKIVYKISTFPCTWSGLENSFFQYSLHRIGSQQMKIYVNFSFWTIEFIRGHPRPLWRPHFDCDLEWPPYIVLWVLFPNNSKFFFVKSCDRFPIGGHPRPVWGWILIANAIDQNSNCHLSSQVSNWKSIATCYIKKLWVIRKKYPQSYVWRSFEVTIKMRPPERPQTTSGDLNGSKWKIYIYFHLLGSYSMQNVLKKWTKMQIPSTKIVQLVTSKMEAEMDRQWNPSMNNENSCLNA